MLRTFTPLQLPGARPRAAAEVLTLTAAIDEASAQPWQMLRIALGIVLLASVLLLLVAVHWASAQRIDRVGVQQGALDRGGADRHART